VRTIVEGEDGV